MSGHETNFHMQLLVLNDDDANDCCGMKQLPDARLMPQTKGLWFHDTTISSSCSNSCHGRHACWWVCFGGFALAGLVDQPMSVIVDGKSLLLEFPCSPSNAVCLFAPLFCACESQLVTSVSQRKVACHKCPTERISLSQMSC